MRFLLTHARRRPRAPVSAATPRSRALQRALTSPSTHDDGRSIYRVFPRTHFRFRSEFTRRLSCDHQTVTLCVSTALVKSSQDCTDVESITTSLQRGGILYSTKPVSHIFVHGISAQFFLACSDFTNCIRDIRRRILKGFIQT